MSLAGTKWQLAWEEQPGKCRWQNRIHYREKCVLIPYEVSWQVRSYAKNATWGVPVYKHWPWVQRKKTVSKKLAWILCEQIELDLELNDIGKMSSQLVQGHRTWKTRGDGSVSWQCHFCLVSCGLCCGSHLEKWPAERNSGRWVCWAARAPRGCRSCGTVALQRSLQLFAWTTDPLHPADTTKHKPPCLLDCEPHPEFDPLLTNWKPVRSQN